MPEVIELQVYVTRVVNGIVQSDSVLTTISITDQDDDGIIDTKEWTDATGSPPGFLRGTADGATQPALWVGDTGNTSAGFIYSNVLFTAGEDLRPLVATLVQNKFEVSFQELNVCFMAGTLIATPQGDRAVESLQVGDLVLTRDRGAQPLVWVGQSQVDAGRLDQSPDLRPIRIEAGALDGNLPRRPLSVSPQHRILVTREDGTEYLVAARHLQVAGAKGFSVLKDDQPFTLFHIACANHEVIEAEGAATESFFTGPMAIKALRPREKLALFAAFPALADGQNPMTPARPFLKRKEVAGLLGDAMVHA